MGQNRDVLFGLIIVDSGLLTKSLVNELMQEWGATADIRFDEYLVREGVLTAEQRQELAARMQESLERYDGSVRAAVWDKLNAQFEVDEDSDDVEFHETINGVLGSFEHEPDSNDHEDADQHTATVVSDFEDSNPHEQTADFVPDQLLGPETVEFKPQQQSRYTLTRVYGEGGLGQVWLAVDPDLKREIALKRIRPNKDSNKDAHTRLIREAQITGQLEHPNIIPVYELIHSDENGRPYYTMKFLRGRTLMDFIEDYHDHKKDGVAEPLELVELLGSFIDVCNAMAYAGSRGIVHRDLKPQNIMLGDFGEVLVLDWGLAKRFAEEEDAVNGERPVELGEGVSRSQTMMGGVVGTPAFMAPEQASGENKNIDARTDVYGLGAVLFSILAGVPPHRGSKTKNSIKDTVDLLKRISSGDTPSVRDVDASIHKTLDAICRKAMQPEPGKRYQDARELAHDVTRYLADERVSVARESVRDRIGRWLRKNRVWAQSIAGAVLIVTAVAIAAAGLIFDAHRNEVAAHEATERALAGESKAKATAQTAEAESTDSFIAARRTVDTLYRDLSESLSEYPAVQKLRASLLEGAAAEYQKLADVRSDVPKLRLESARALVRLGDVWRLLGNFENSTNAYRNALERLAALPDEEAAGLEARSERVTCLNGLGLTWGFIAPVETKDRVAKSVGYYKEADRAVKQLLTEFPQRVELRQLESRVKANHGSLLSRTNQIDQSLQLLAEAETGFERIAETAATPENIEELAKARVARARVLLIAGNIPEAKAAFEQAIDVYKRLVAEHKKSTEFLRGLADARLTLANASNEDDTLSERLASYLECVDDYLALLNARPDVPLFRQNLVSAEANVAQVLGRLGRNHEAAQHAKTALEQVMHLVNANPPNLDFDLLEVYVRVTFGQVLRDTGNFADAEVAFSSAIGICESLVKQYPNDMSVWRVYAEATNNLGVLLLLTNQANPARQAFAVAGERFKNALKINPKNGVVANGYAWSLSYLADALRELSRAKEAAGFYDKAFQVRHDLSMSNAAIPFEIGQATVWLWLNCPDESKRNLTDAKTLAERLAARHPKSGRCRVLLVMSHYRNGDYELALKVVGEAKRFVLGNRSPIHFLEAMTLSKLNQPIRAKAVWDHAVRVMDENTSGNLRLRRIRAEAGQLVGETTAVSVEPPLPKK
ncbi:MAG: protein kinase [Planctomycetota bacterium]|nr:protein kinase [Planctomycetota bacterium]